MRMQFPVATRFITPANSMLAEVALKTRGDAAPVVVLGAGPAGLTTAYELSNLGIPCVVLEKDSVVGGLARTVEHDGFRFDIGGHRFYTKVPLIAKIWQDILGDDLLTRTRTSRIYYRSRFFRYPLEPIDALRGLGIVETGRCVISFLKSCAFPEKSEADFASWVINRFGRRLFEIFFKSYTEKVWGMDCRQIQADWAAQRIRGLSLATLLRDVLLPDTSRDVKSLIREFKYPRLGPGMLWSRMRDILNDRGVQVVLNAPVEAIHWNKDKVISVEAGGKTYRGSNFISSLSIRDLFRFLTPSVAEHFLTTAKQLQYRDFITVALMVPEKNLFPDNWIYVHDPSVRAGRVQNYGNWSPDMVPSPNVTCLGVEYFCRDSEEIWQTADSELVELAQRELRQIGLLRREHMVISSAVVRMPKAYPVYDKLYRAALSVVREFLTIVPNLQLVGRNGMHRYNNQDHSMLTGLLAARNIAGAHFDLWNLNADGAYLEEGLSLTNEQLSALNMSQPFVPTPV